MLEQATAAEIEIALPELAATADFARRLAPLLRTGDLVGLAVAIDSPWILLMLIPADLFIHRFVVLREEAAMERQFGEAYRRYKAGVRRWL